MGGFVLRIRAMGSIIACISRVEGHGLLSVCWGCIGLCWDVG